MPSVELALQDLEEEVVAPHDDDVVRRGFVGSGRALRLHGLARVGFDPLSNEPAGEDPPACDPSAGKAALAEEAIDVLLVDPEVRRDLATGEEVTRHSQLRVTESNQKCG